MTLSGAGITGPDADGVYHSTAVSGTVNVAIPAGAASAKVNARLTVIEGANCTDLSEVRMLTVLPELAAAITEKARDGANLAVSVTGSAPGATSLQWQRLSGGSWVNIAGATSTTLSYSSFEADATPSVQEFNIDGAPFSGKLWQVQVRLHAERNVGGILCTADSPAVPLKKVTAVDP